VADQQSGNGTSGCVSKDAGDVGRPGSRSHVVLACAATTRWGSRDDEGTYIGSFADDRSCNAKADKPREEPEQQPEYEVRGVQSDTTLRRPLMEGCDNWRRPRRARWLREENAERRPPSRGFGSLAPAQR